MNCNPNHKNRFLFQVLKLVILIFPYFVCKAQNSVEPSKNASSQGAINNYSTPSVNHATGIMSFGIPLMVDKTGALTIPVNLNYAAKGIKTQQQSGPVGIGWSFNATGVVTRVVRGLPDDDPNGRLRLPHPLTASHQVDLNASFFSDLDKGTRDGEPDIFTVSYGDINEDFILKDQTINNIKTYKAIPLRKTNIKISVILGGSQIAGFSVIDENGNKLSFTIPETVLTNMNGLSSAYATGSRKFTSAWYLDEYTAYTGEKATFEYASDFFSSYRTDLEKSELYYGKKWIVFGQNQTLRNQYEQLVNQLTTDLTLRATLMNHIYSLSEEQRYLLKKAYESAAITSRYSFMADFMGTDKFAVSNPYEQIYNGYQSQLNALQSQINIFGKHIFDLGTPITQNNLKLKLQQLAETPTEESSKLLETPRGLYTNVKMLKRIAIGDVSFNFNYNAVSLAGKPRSLLDNIEKKDGRGNILERIELEYSLGSTSAGVRPFLKTVRIVGDPGTSNDDIITKFEYFDETLSYDDRQKDFFGFYNGQYVGEAYLPDLNGLKVPIARRAGYSFAQGFFLRNRYSSGTIPVDTAKTRSFEFLGNFAKTHSLKTVKLPTGGKYEFDYESNTVSTRTSTRDSISGKTILGGIRIRSISSTDENKIVSKRTFKYDFKRAGTNYAESTGFYTKTRYVSPTLAMRYAFNPDDNLIAPELFDMGFQYRDAGNENIFYSYVEEHSSGNGSVGYEYLDFVPKDSIYPYWLENLPLSRSIYDNSGRLASIEKYKYQADMNDVVPFLRNSEYIDRFIAKPAHGFKNELKQYKAFPFRLTFDLNPQNYSSNTDSRTFFNEYLMVYEPNIVPRSAPKLDSLVYRLRYGGDILLSQSEKWVSSGDGPVLTQQPLEEKYSHRLFYQGFAYPGITETKSLLYENVTHRYPTQQIIAGPDGSKVVFKTKRALDFNLGATPYIDSLLKFNRLHDPLEQQQWILEPGESNWKLTAGQQIKYGEIKLSPENGFKERNIMVPVLSSDLELETAIISGTAGWNEAFTSIPPYSTTNFNNPLSKPKQQFFWNSSYNGARLVGTKSVNGLPGKSVLANYSEEIEVTGADGDEILKLPTTGSYKIKSRLSDYQNFESYDIYGGQIEFIRDLRSRVLQTGFNPELSETFPHNLLVNLDSIFDMIAQRSFSEKLNDRITGLLPLMGVPLSDFNKRNQLNTFCTPHTSFDELFTVFMALMNIATDGNGDFSIFDENALITPEARLTARMPLAKYLISGKRVEFNTTDAVQSRSFRITYTDGTLPYTATVTLNQTDNGFRRGYVSLSAIPNYTKVRDMEIDVTTANSNYVLFALPEGSPFMLRQFDNRGLLLSEKSSRGDSRRFIYDGQGRLKQTLDRDGNIVSHLDYNLKAN